MLTRIQFLATRWAFTAATLTTLLSVSISNEAWAQAIHPAQRAIAAAEAEKASEAETDPDKQSLESLIAPIVRDAVQAELKSAKAAQSTGDPMAQTSSADPFADLIEKLRTSVGEIARNFDRVMVIASNLEGHANRAFLLLTDLEGWPVVWAGLLRCLVPEIDGALFSQVWKDALWDRYFTGAPARQRRSVEQYKIVKRA